ncbi:glucose-6-phosphate isomerase [Oceanicaulis sp.]|uniref:glucose-6-phosphate isomerase n=1 Tax=Oceanicaulis sp. TaxID=1924941 RepID=UPI003BABBCAD
MTSETGMKAIAAAQARVDMASLLSDESRSDALQFEAAGLYLDLRRQKLTLQTWRALVERADVLGVDERLAALFAGEIVNGTEQRPALHPACRNPALLGESDAAAAMIDTRKKTRAFAALMGRPDALDGHPVRRVVNIGIGGSDLGPRFVYDALGAFRRDGVETHFVSNLDPADLDDALDGADPETTLILVISKSFTTQETLMNARAARAWIVKYLGEAGVSARFAAATACPDKAKAFGLDEDRIFAFLDGVGGRYSLWSAAGLALETGLGSDVFDRLLKGARAMDEHVATTPLARNMPVAKALIDVFNRAGLGLPSRCVAAYSSRLERLPSYLQQLEMESLGKSVNAEGQPLSEGHSGPLVWGGRGSDLQHSVFQWLHQGLDEAPVDFIAIADHGRNDERVRALNANLAAQGAALTHGRTGEGDLAKHKAIRGGRASATFVMDRLSPETLGALIALHEHKVFVEAVIYGLNPFDQWGVELGKSLARSILSGDMAGFDGPARELTHRLGLD